MSEYQYYEFQAVDRPLTQGQMSMLRACSSRAQITSNSFINVYNYGSFKGNEDEWIEKYFDAFLYLSNWGTRQIMFRIPQKLLDPQILALYSVGRSSSYREKKENIILSFRSEDEEPEWVEGDGRLAAIIQTRSELMRGDHRILYIGWLLVVQSGEIDDNTLEPPVPPGLGELNAPLDRFAEFMRIDGDLLSAAAERSSEARTIDLTREEIKTWILNLPAGEKDEILARVIDGNDLHLGAELRQRAIVSLHGVKKPATGERRTVGDIIGRSEILADERRKREAQEREMEKTRREREQAERRGKHLQSLAGKEPGLWGNVDELIATGLPKRYDEAVSLLVDLRDLAAMKGDSADFSRRIRALRNEHARKPSLMGKFRAAKLSE